MTIKTLTYIHNLLKEDVETQTNAKLYIQEVYNNALEEGKENASFLRQQYETQRRKLREAENALDDFEAKEW